MCSELLWSELHQAVAIALDGYYSNKEGKLNVQRANDIINIRSLIDNIIDPDCLVQELIIYLGSMSSGWRLGFWKRAHGQLHQQLSELINIYQQSIKCDIMKWNLMTFYESNRIQQNFLNL